MNKAIAIFSGILCILLFSGGTKRIENRSALTTTPERLELSVDRQTDPYTVRVEYILNVPANYIPPSGRLVYKPYFIALGEQYDLTPLIIAGRKYIKKEIPSEASPENPNVLHLVSNGDGMRIKLSQVVPFEMWMAGAKLRAEVALETPRRKADICVLTLAKGVLGVN